MTNKETLQNHNIKLTNNNDSLLDLVNQINALPEAKEYKFQDKTIEPTKELQIITADETFDALNEVTVNAIPEEYIIPSGTLEITDNGEKDVTNYANVNVNIETKEDLEEELNTYVSKVNEQKISIQSIIFALENKTNGSGAQAKYIEDGMIAWFDGYDEMDEEGHWNNRLGDDYIYTHYTTSSGPIPHINNGYVNSKNYALITTADYYKQDYTIEVVGKVNSQNNSNGSTGGWLFTMNETGSWGIGFKDSTGEISFINSGASRSEKQFTGYYGKTFTAALNITQFIARKAHGISTNKASVNGCDWFNVIETSNAAGNCYGDNHGIMCYYPTAGSRYMIDGTIHCIRVYNRLLTAEELAYNYELDRKRFNF